MPKANETNLFTGTTQEVPSRLPGYHSEQFFIHENTYNSLVQARRETYLPFNFTDSENVLFASWPHLTGLCAGGFIDISLDWLDISARPVRFYKDRGCVLGEHVTTSATIKCNENVLLELEMNLIVKENTTLQSMFYYQ